MDSFLSDCAILQDMIKGTLCPPPLREARPTCLTVAANMRMLQPDVETDIVSYDDGPGGVRVCVIRKRGSNIDPPRVLVRSDGSCAGDIRAALEDVLKQTQGMGSAELRVLEASLDDRSTDESSTPAAGKRRIYAYLVEQISSSVNGARAAVVSRPPPATSSARPR